MQSWQCMCVINNDNWQLKAIDRQFLDSTRLDWADAASVLAFAQLLRVLRQARLVCGSCGNHSLFSRLYTPFTPLFLSLSLCCIQHLHVWVSFRMRLLRMHLPHYQSPQLPTYPPPSTSPSPPACPSASTGLGPISIDDFIAITRTKYFSTIHFVVCIAFVAVALNSIVVAAAAVVLVFVIVVGSIIRQCHNPGITTDSSTVSTSHPSSLPALTNQSICNYCQLAAAFD